ncbi:DNA repair protein rad52 [Neonectria punicea]|uniref:DNA repair protein rad52 n=1 Tax=Neonectria punicea TaxID=979145 RepID=A0ABR1H2N7_9HYPO
MPAPGQQHTTVANPFLEQRPRVSEWTAKEIATISARLDKQLGPEYISARAGPGGAKVHYLTAEKCITLANEVFGFNGWSSSIQNIQVDFADENPQTQRVSIGLSVIVRITLRDGTFHEDIGYGSIENAKGKAMAFEKAKKEGTTDGMKRALRSFGNVLGNCIYDKDYVKQVTKIKAEPVRKFDQDSLHRHSDFVKQDVPRAEPIAKAAPVTTAIKTEPHPAVSESFEDFLGELDEADFCVPEDGHPDEVMLSTSIIGHAPSEKSTNTRPQEQQIAQQPGRSFSGGPTNRPPQTPNQAQTRTEPSNTGQQGLSNRPQPAPIARTTTPNQAGGPRPPPPAPPNGNALEAVGFFSARAVSQLPESTIQGTSNARLSLPHGPQAFNPKAESPSIRKTPGIDHSSSKPVSRSGQHVPPTSSQAETSAPPQKNTGGFTPVRPPFPSSQGARTNMVNPSLDQTRRIGAPGGPGSPLANRGSYRPPTMKRPPPGDANTGRPALADLPANGSGPTANAATANGLEAKRQKMA